MDLADLLAGMGNEIFGFARTEEDAVASALNLRPNLMIGDRQLDSGSGFATMQRILAHGLSRMSM